MATIKAMFKKLSLFLLILSVFILSACGQPPPDRTLRFYTGTIKVEGNYYVVETDNDKFRLRSTFLDLAPYLNKKMRLHGQFSQDVFFVDDIKLPQQ
ncbi:hypothetical protein HY030_00265 [Candidatus Gottesmanbacteria bacterium]|nr:hypothetical protein [Candidatus Gottesmanbacteria bacterium]